MLTGLAESYSVWYTTRGDYGGHRVKLVTAFYNSDFGARFLDSCWLYWQLFTLILQISRLKTSQSAKSAWLHVVSIHSARSTCSGSLSPSNTRNRTLKRSNHQRCSQLWPWDFMSSKSTVRARVRTSNLHRLNKYLAHKNTSKKIRFIADKWLKIVAKMGD